MMKHHPATFWGTLLFLNILLFVPLLLLKESTLVPLPPLGGERGWYDTFLFFLRRENYDIFRLSVDLYVAVTLLAVIRNGKWNLRVRRLSVVFYFVLLFYQVYESVSLEILGQRPLLYSDVLLLRDAAYLLVDVWTPGFLYTGLKILLGIAFIAFIVPFSFSVIAGYLRSLHINSKVIIPASLAWLFILFMTFWFSFLDIRPVTQWISPKIVQNVHQSVVGFRDLRRIDREQLDHYAYDNIRIGKRPNIYMIMVESYGKIVASHHDLRQFYDRFMGEIEDALRKEGWFATTNYSAAPISGGRSWLSMATLLSGTRIHNQALNIFLMKGIPEYPHMIRFLRRQGYHTFTLQPVMRKRLGFSFEHYQAYYDFNTWVYFDDLDYTGEIFGWGMVPDQYSINYAHDKYLASTGVPYFLFFATVMSHAPWYDLPPYPADWRTLNATEFHKDEPDISEGSEMWDKTKARYTQRVTERLGLKDVFKLEDYLNHMEYQIRVITDYIVDMAPDNSVFIIIGDHQPPKLSPIDQGFQTPVHVVSTDRTFVDALQSYGFVPGTTKPSDLGGAIRHEALYSILVRTLAEHSGQPVPEYFPNGIPLFDRHP